MVSLVIHIIYVHLYILAFVTCCCTSNWVSQPPALGGQQPNSTIPHTLGNLSNYNPVIGNLDIIQAKI